MHFLRIATLLEFLFQLIALKFDYYISEEKISIFYTLHFQASLHDISS